jgi:hypothetical protein
MAIQTPFPAVMETIHQLQKPFTIIIIQNLVSTLEKAEGAI